MRPWKVAATVLMWFGFWAAAQVSAVHAAEPDGYIGTWKGEWESGGAGGRFDLTFSRGSDGKLAASVAVGSDMGDYNANLSTVSFAGNKLSGAYDYPPDARAEVTIAGAFDPKSATGTWSLGAKGQSGG